MRTCKTAARVARRQSLYTPPAPPRAPSRGGTQMAFFKPAQLRQCSMTDFRLSSSDRHASLPTLPTTSNASSAPLLPHPLPNSSAIRALFFPPSAPGAAAVGLHLAAKVSGGHVVTEITKGSPASACANLDVGDEIVEVNLKNCSAWTSAVMDSELAGPPGTMVELGVLKVGTGKRVTALLIRRGMSHPAETGFKRGHRDQAPLAPTISPGGEIESTPRSQPSQLDGVHDISTDVIRSSDPRSLVVKSADSLLQLPSYSLRDSKRDSPSVIAVRRVVSSPHTHFNLAPPTELSRSDSPGNVSSGWTPRFHPEYVSQLESTIVDLKHQVFALDTKLQRAERHERQQDFEAQSAVMDIIQSSAEVHYMLKRIEFWVQRERKLSRALSSQISEDIRACDVELQAKATIWPQECAKHERSMDDPSQISEANLAEIFQEMQRAKEEASIWKERTEKLEARLRTSNEDYTRLEQRFETAEFHVRAIEMDKIQDEVSQLNHQNEVLRQKFIQGCDTITKSQRQQHILLECLKEVTTFMRTIYVETEIQLTHYNNSSDCLLPPPLVHAALLDNSEDETGMVLECLYDLMAQGCVLRRHIELLSTEVQAFETKQRSHHSALLRTNDSLLSFLGIGSNGGDDLVSFQSLAVSIEAGLAGVGADSQNVWFSLGQAQERVESLERLLETLSTVFRTHNRTNKGLLDRIHFMSVQQHELQALDHKTYREEIDRLQRTMQTKDDAISELQSKLDSLDAEKSEIMQSKTWQITSLEQELNDLRRSMKLQELEYKNKTIEADARLHERLETPDKQIRTLLDMLKAENSKLQEANTHLQTQLDQKGMHTSQSSVTEQQLRVQASMLQGMLDTQQAEHAAMGSQIQVLTAKNQQLNADAERALQQITDMQQSAFEKDMQDQESAMLLAQQLSDHQANLQNSRIENSRLIEEITLLRNHSNAELASAAERSESFRRSRDAAQIRLALTEEVLAEVVELCQTTNLFLRDSMAPGHNDPPIVRVAHLAAAYKSVSEFPDSDWSVHTVLETRTEELECLRKEIEVLKSDQEHRKTSNAQTEVSRYQTTQAELQEEQHKIAYLKSGIQTLNDHVVELMHEMQFEVQSAVIGVSQSQHVFAHMHQLNASLEDTVRDNMRLNLHIKQLQEEALLSSPKFSEAEQTIQLLEGKTKEIEDLKEKLRTSAQNELATKRYYERVLKDIQPGSKSEPDVHQALAESELEVEALHKSVSALTSEKEWLTLQHQDQQEKIWELQQEQAALKLTKEIDSAGNSPVTQPTFSNSVDTHQDVISPTFQSIQSKALRTALEDEIRDLREVLQSQQLEKDMLAQQYAIVQNELKEAKATIELFVDGETPRPSPMAPPRYYTNLQSQFSVAHDSLQCSHLALNEGPTAPVQQATQADSVLKVPVLQDHSSPYGTDDFIRIAPQPLRRASANRVASPIKGIPTFTQEELRGASEIAPQGEHVGPGQSPPLTLKGVAFSPTRFRSESKSASASASVKNWMSESSFATERREEENVGIGVVLSMRRLANKVHEEHSDDLAVVVVELLPGMPAKLHSSMNVGSRILEVDGFSVVGLTLSEIRQVVSGPPESPVLIKYETMAEPGRESRQEQVLLTRSRMKRNVPESAPQMSHNVPLLDPAGFVPHHLSEPGACYASLSSQFSFSSSGRGPVSSTRSSPPPEFPDLVDLGQLNKMISSMPPQSSRAASVPQSARATQNEPSPPQRSSLGRNDAMFF